MEAHFRGMRIMTTFSLTATVYKQDQIISRLQALPLPIITDCYHYSHSRLLLNVYNDSDSLTMTGART